mgnify:CR=1 FL=1
MALNNQNSENVKTRISRIASDALHIMCDFLVAVCRVIVWSLLWMARNVWKRYFGIETLIYKWWWKAHAKSMQKKLDKCHQIHY